MRLRARVVRLLAVGAVALGAAGCATTAQGDPVEIDRDDVPFGLLRELPSTTSTPDPAPPTSTPSAATPS